MLTLLDLLNDQIDPTTGRITTRLGWLVVLGLNLAAFGGAALGLTLGIIGV